MVKDSLGESHDCIADLKSRLEQYKNEIKTKDAQIENLTAKVRELEMSNENYLGQATANFFKGPRCRRRHQMKETYSTIQRRTHDGRDLACDYC